MDDIIALIIRILDPVVIYLGPHAVAAVAILGGVVTFFSSRKQRAREKRLESKVDLLIRVGGHTWNAEKFSMSAVYRPQSPLSFCKGKSLARRVESFTGPIMTVYQTLLRSVGNVNLSKPWLISVLGWVVLQINAKYGIEIPNTIVNAVADILIFVLPFAFAWLNRKKGDTTVAKYKIDDNEFVG